MEQRASGGSLKIFERCAEMNLRQLCVAARGFFKNEKIFRCV